MILNRRYRGKIEKIPLPAQNGTLTYNGNAQSPVWNNYDAAKLTIGGTTSSVNAGTFTATFTPKKGYCWQDGGRDAKNAAWSIGKAAGSLSLNKTSLSLNNATKTGTVIITRAGDGAITAASSNTSVVSVSVSGTTLTVTGNDIGSAAITVTVAAGTNHTAPTSKTIAVTAFVVPPLAQCTAAKVKQVAQSGQAPNAWSVGDKIPIKLSGTVGALTLNNTYYAFIIGFNHNSSIEGNNTIHFQFGKRSDGTDIAFCDSGYGKTYADASTARFVINTTYTGKNGWEASYMRNTICPAFLSVMPAEWRNIIVLCKKYSANADGAGITATSDKIWLLSEFELYGTCVNSYSAEQNYQKQYDYYKAGNSKVKIKHDYTSATCSWWLRSRDPKYASDFCRGTDGGALSGSLQSHYSRGFAPGFMVA